MAEDDNSGAVRAINCPACGAALEIRAAGYTITLVCEHCGSTIDTADPDARLISKFSKAQATLEISLGRRGSLRGIEWQAIGYLRRSSGGARWEEYLLFNPYWGYRWLSKQYGRWSFGTMLMASLEVGLKTHWRGRAYRLFFNRSTARVDYVLGEFYWRVQAGEEVAATEYARPGATLAMEENDAERSWTLNEYLYPDEIKAAFPGVATARWFPGSTPAPHEPSPFAGLIKPWGIIALIASVLLMLFGSFLGPPQFLDRFDIPVVMEQPETTRSFGPIQLDAPWQGVTVAAATPNVDQGWTDIDLAFVNRQTQESYEAYALNEHYYGVDADGPWSEGGRDQIVKIASLPAGTYDLVADVSGHAWSDAATLNMATGQYEIATDPNLTVSISIYKGADFSGNTSLAIFLVLAPFLGMWWLHYMFDKARLEEMDRDPEIGDWIAGYVTP